MDALLLAVERKHMVTSHVLLVLQMGNILRMTRGSGDKTQVTCLGCRAR